MAIRSIRKQLDRQVGRSPYGVRLWEQDVAAALASGNPGLVALSLLMHGATVALVEEAVRLITTHSLPPNQEELLAALGVFADPLIETDRFIRLVTKEKLMATDLISYLMQEKTAEFEQERADLEKRLLEQQELVNRSLQDALEEIGRNRAHPISQRAISARTSHSEYNKYGHSPSASGCSCSGCRS